MTSLDIIEMIKLDINAIYPKKDVFHKNVIKNWLHTQNIPYSFEEMWKIREDCILELSK